jgi:hypothetical protein
MNKHTIFIDKDGSVTLTTYDPLYMVYGLGDIGVDVEIVDQRITLPSREAVEKAMEQTTIDQQITLERARILEEVEKLKISLFGMTSDKDKLEYGGYNEALTDIIKIIKGKVV